MGNCLRHQSSTNKFSDYDDHYWDEFSTDEEYGSCDNKSFATPSTNNNSSTTTTTEVKIKITKKQLAEWLGKVDVKELRVEQVLAQLLAQSHHHAFDHVNRPWRPALQSIPEVN